jgi:sulfur-oxidizing protein SoxY
VPSRRDLLRDAARVATVLGACGLLPDRAQAQPSAWNSAAFEARTIADAMKALGAGTPVQSREVTIAAPDIAENGAAVPIGASTALAGVARILIVVEKNPAVLSALFNVTDAVEPSFSTRLKMDQFSNVYAIAMMNDGRVLFARKEVTVTLGGCVG